MFSYLWIRPVLPPGWQNGLGAHWAGMSRRAVTHCGEYRHLQVGSIIAETAPLLRTLLCVTIADSVSVWPVANTSPQRASGYIS